MKVGEVKVAEDSDFQELKSLCRLNDGWEQEYNKHSITVWTKTNENTSFKMIKVNIMCFCYKKMLSYAKYWAVRSILNCR